MNLGRIIHRLTHPFDKVITRMYRDELQHRRDLGAIRQEREKIEARQNRIKMLQAQVDAMGRRRTP